MVLVPHALPVGDVVVRARAAKVGVSVRVGSGAVPWVGGLGRRPCDAIDRPTHLTPALRTDPVASTPELSEVLEKRGGEAVEDPLPECFLHVGAEDLEGPVRQPFSEVPHQLESFVDLFGVLRQHFGYTLRKETGTMAAKKHLTVYSVNPSTWERTKLAEFSLHGGDVTSKFEDKHFKHEVVTEGIVLRGRVYKPEDGAKFMEALGQAFSRSSTIAVEAT